MPTWRYASARLAPYEMSASWGLESGELYIVGMAWRATKAPICSRRLASIGSPATINAPAARWTSAAKAASISRGMLALRMKGSCLASRAAACTSCNSLGVSTLFGFMSTAIAVASGTSSRMSSRRLAISVSAKKVTPVALPSGRARLHTRPALTRSEPLEKTRNRRCRGLSCESGSWAAGRSDHGHPAAHQVSDQRWQSIILTVRPTVLDRYVLALDVADFFKSLVERGDHWRKRIQRYSAEEPDHRHRASASTLTSIKCRFHRK